MATKKSGGISRNGRDSNSKKLGLKVNSLENINNKSILILGHKLKINLGSGVKFNKNYSIICINKLGGFVKFLKIKNFKKKFIFVL